MASDLQGEKRKGKARVFKSVCQQTHIQQCDKAGTLKA